MSGERKSRTRGTHRPAKHRVVTAFIRANLPVIRFVMITFTLLIAAYFILKIPWLERRVVEPYTHFVAACSRFCLGLIGVRAAGSGAMIVSPEFSVAIKNVCNGLEVTAIFLATTVAFPSTTKSKLVGLLIGFPVIFFVNIVRIMVLFVLGARNPQVFDDVHFYYAQALVIIVTVAVWLLWVTTFSVYGSKTRHRLSG